MASKIAYYETTPYAVEKVSDQYFVRQTWWGKNVAGPFGTECEARDAVIEEARRNRCLKTRYLKSA